MVGRSIVYYCVYCNVHIGLRVCDFPVGRDLELLRIGWECLELNLGIYKFSQLFSLFILKFHLPFELC